MNRKTKIIATIGPASLEFMVFQKMVDEGIDYIRINTSYGNFDQYDLILNNLKNVNKNREIQVIYDIKNIKVLSYAKSRQLNTIALSFAENADQVERVRKEMGQGSSVFIVSKIESKKGVDNFDDILEASDGIMIARGDLSQAVSLEKVPPLQRQFTRKAVEKGKFLITATEMLLSMVDNQHPTNAEASDVANAVFSGSSAVMLSEETAIGKYPVESVAYMRKIIQEAEHAL